MKVFIHLGFPKTGTTSLQKWLHVNSAKLEASGILYPRSLRDSEGDAHHLMTDLANSNVQDLASSLLAACKEKDLSSALLSCEGLCNRLTAKDGSGGEYFNQLFRIAASKHQIHYLLTIRKIDSYLKSIAIQNILFNGGQLKPSIHASHQLNALRIAYTSIKQILQESNMTLFTHSLDVNKQIISTIYEENGAKAPEAIETGREHRSPENSMIMLFMWINSQGLTITRSLFNFLRFNPAAATLIDEYYLEKNLDKLSENHCAAWSPPRELILASMKYSEAMWREFFSIPAVKACNDNSQLQKLTEHISRDFTCLIPQHLPKFDFLHFYVRTENGCKDISNIFSSVKEMAPNS